MSAQTEGYLRTLITALELRVQKLEEQVKQLEVKTNQLDHRTVGQIRLGRCEPIG